MEIDLRDFEILLNKAGDLEANTEFSADWVTLIRACILTSRFSPGSPTILSVEDMAVTIHAALVIGYIAGRDGWEFQTDHLISYKDLTLETAERIRGIFVGFLEKCAKI